MNEMMLSLTVFLQSKVCVLLCVRTYAVVPTALGGVVLAAFPLFLRSSSFTGSLTLTPWYGLDADASDSAVSKNTP